jgi:polysaccharide export outer membrane protein
MKSPHKIILVTALLGVCLSSAGGHKASVASDVKSALGLSGKHIGIVDDTYQADLLYANTRYRVAPTDVISLTFPLTPEFNQTVNVLPDGFVSLIGIGNVRLEGLTTEECAAAVRAAYSNVLNNPIVAVDLKDFNRPSFIVAGRVNNPGKYELRAYTSAIQAISIAGGFSNGADWSNVLVFRRAGNDWYEAKPLHLKRILQGRDVNEDPEVRPGDMLFVQHTSILKK